jgi:hypothetical protein
MMAVDVVVSTAAAAEATASRVTPGSSLAG